MSLNVYLEMPNTWNDWNRHFPNHDPIRVELGESHEVFWKNITHNLGSMAKAAEIYNHLWRPEEIGVTSAHQLIEPLRVGLDHLQSMPDKFRAFNPKNGWGTYELLVTFVQVYLHACETYPDASVRVSR
jgi:hypothetical protein